MVVVVVVVGESVVGGWWCGVLAQPAESLLLLLLLLLLTACWLVAGWRLGLAVWAGWSTQQKQVGGGGWRRLAGVRQAGASRVCRADRTARNKNKNRRQGSQAGGSCTPWFDIIILQVTAVSCMHACIHVLGSYPPSLLNSMPSTRDKSLLPFPPNRQHNTNVQYNTTPGHLYQ